MRAAITTADGAIANPTPDAVAEALTTLEGAIAAADGKKVDTSLLAKAHARVEALEAHFYQNLSHITTTPAVTTRTHRACIPTGGAARGAE